MRRRKTLLAGAGLLCAGLLYGYVLIPLGLRIPCLFRRFTGLRCPGCGVTDLCLELLHGRFVPGYNWGLVLTAPWIPVLLLAEKHRPNAARVSAWVLAALLLAWGVLRNLWGI